MTLFKNQVVRIKKYKYLPSGWTSSMRFYMGCVVVIRDFRNGEEYISSVTDDYDIFLQTTFHSSDLRRWCWRQLDFEKVNTLTGHKKQNETL
jgi:hypothetical protein